MNATLWSAPDGPWRGHGIAIVGMAARLPMADTVEAFWRNLVAGRDCISNFSREQLLAEGVSPELLDHERYVRAGAVLDGIDLFDAAFFGISPREAESMDPQQRLFLEVMQHAFDDAGLDPQRCAGSIGVYAGARLSGYWLRLMKNAEFMASLGWHQVAAGNDKDFLATQASYRFDLRGPSVNVLAACSTSLLAVSLGCDALVNRRCDVAVAGAASIAVPQRTGYMHQPSSIASSDGRCRPFDAGADGSVLGNGVAAVVLKRLDDALAANDRIYAVLRAVAVNNDGSSKSSFAAPSVRAQADVLRRALHEAAVDPAGIGYVEAHGTATALGDPIEVAALSRVFAGGRGAPLPIGSVKSNVGHLDPAAGLASLIKTALCLSEQRIPASLHFERPNPAIDFSAAGVRVVAAGEAWAAGPHPRRAGVSAFGIGGTNVHAVLEEAPKPAANETAAQAELLLLSAKSAEALQSMTGALAEHLPQHRPPLRDAAFTLALGRRQFRHRRAVVAADPVEAAGLLAAPPPNGTAWIKDRPVIFVFPGQGSQRNGMGLALYQREPVFRQTLDELLNEARPYLGFDARALIDAAAHGNGTEHDLTQTAIAQPLLFAVEVACARLWLHWGVEPAQMLGHSIGELAAAHVAGILPADDAMRVVCRRGQLMQQMQAGAMLALSVPAEEAVALARELEPGDACIAAFNAPRQQTLSVSLEALPRVEEQLRARGIEPTRLATSHAFHHSSMQPAADEWRRELSQVALERPSLGLISCVTGEPLTDDAAVQADYWARSIVQPVHFSRAVQSLLASHGEAVFIECGPGRALGFLLRAHGGAASRTVMLATLPVPGNPEAERHNVLAALGQAWEAGLGIDWQAVWQGREARRIALPGYPFQRKRFWVDEPREAAGLVPAPMQPSAPVPASGVAPIAAQPSGEHSYVRTWVPATAPPAVQTGASVILLAADGGLETLLGERLRRDGAQVIVVRPGPGGQVGQASGLTDVLGVDPQDPSGMPALAQQIATRLKAGKPLQVVNAWPLALPPGSPSLARAAQGVTLSFRAPLRLFRALQAASLPVAALDTITRLLFPLQPGEWPEPAVAPALGLARVLSQEIQGSRARVIDTAPPASLDEARHLVEQLARELRQPGPEAVLACRGGSRLAEAFVPVPLPPPHALGQLRPRGCYLITGGFGAIGGVLATSLAKASMGARIALVGRRGLARDGGSDGEAARRLVSSLQALGAEVQAFAADVAQPDAMRGVVGELQTRWGRIDGVVHCAGVAGGRMLIMPEGEGAGEVLAPKVQGTLALLEAVAPHRPDFIVMCSSFAAVAGGLGQGEYCAANAFVDAMAWSARAMGLRATAVNWPAWREAGMATAIDLPAELQHLRQASLASGITSAEGAELFLRIIAADLPQVVVTPLASQAAPHVATAAQAERAPAAPPRKPVALPMADAHQSPTLPGGVATDGAEALLADCIGGIWSAVLGIPPPKSDDNFFELGGQSLMALQIVSRCREQFDVNINLTEVFDHPTLAAFSALVHRRMEEQVDAMPEAEVHRQLAAGAA